MTGTSLSPIERSYCMVIPCAGEERLIAVRNCPFPFVKLSPIFPATSKPGIDGSATLDSFVSKPEILVVSEKVGEAPKSLCRT